MSKLTAPLTNDPVSNSGREAEMFSLRFTPDWEAEIEMDVYELDGNGQRIFDKIDHTPGLTDKQRTEAKSKYWPKRPQPYTTKGSMVDSQTGEVDPEGDVKEIDFLFSLTFAQLKAMLGKTDNDSVLQAVKEFVGLKMQDIAARGQI